MGMTWFREWETTRPYRLASRSTRRRPASPDDGETLQEAASRPITGMMKRSAERGIAGSLP